MGRRVGWLGKDESCDCPYREVWLNWFGEWVARRLR